MFVLSLTATSPDTETEYRKEGWSSPWPLSYNASESNFSCYLFVLLCPGYHERRSGPQAKILKARGFVPPGLYLCRLTGW